MPDHRAASALGAVRAALKGDYELMVGFLMECGVPEAHAEEVRRDALAAKSFAEDLLDMAREDARAGGYSAGRSDGYSEGRADGREEMMERDA